MDIVIALSLPLGFRIFGQLLMARSLHFVLLAHLGSGVFADRLCNEFDKSTSGSASHSASQVLEVNTVGDHHIGGILGE